MKLNFLFVVMDLLTLLAYPIVLVHGKLRRISRAVNFRVRVPATSTQPIAPKRVLKT